MVRRGFPPLREEVLTFVFGVPTSARECQTSRKVSTGVKVSTAKFLKGTPFVILQILDRAEGEF